MDPFTMSMLQQAIGTPFGSGGRAPAGIHQLPPEQQAALFRMRQQQAMSQMPQNMSIPQKYLWAQANHISPAQVGLTPGQIYASEQGLTGYSLDPRTGQITKSNAYGGRDPVDPMSLNQTINTNLGGSFGMENGQMVNDASWINGSNGTSNLGMSGYNAPGSAGAAVSNLGGGAANPNNAAGGLYGAQGNQVRQQMMDSSQFNPNGANTYAIQNMNLSGQGALGSNMGGMPSNGLFGGAVPASSTTNTNPTPAVTSDPTFPGAVPPTSTANGGGNHNVIQGGVRGGVNGGAFTGTLPTGGTPGTGTGTNFNSGTQTTNTSVNTPQTPPARTTSPSYFGGNMTARAQPMRTQV